MKRVCNFPKLLSYKIGKLSKRVLALVLASIVLISAINISFVFANESIEPAVNYPALDSFTEGAAPSADSVWVYGVRDFAEKAVFEISTGDFEAPLAVWNANDGYATVTWNTVADAQGYVLNIFEDTQKIYSIPMTGTQWQSSAAESLEGGKNYEIQVIATNNGQNIAASDIRTFKAQQAEVITPYYINNFNASEDLDNVTFARFKSKALSNNQLVMETDTTRNLARIYLKTSGISNTSAKAVMFYIKPDTEMLQTFRVAFGATAKTADLKYTASGETDNVYYVSAANPNNTITGAVSNTTTSNLDLGYSAYCQGGYYVIIPLSLYDATIRQGIADGTYSYCEILLQNIKYKDAETGAFNGAGNFDGTNIIFDEICLIDDIDAYLKQLRQEYNKVYDVDKYNEILKEDSKETAYSYTGGVSALGAVLTADQFSANALTNATANTGYKLSNNKASRKVVIEATSKASFNYGSHFKFVAPADGIYDFGGTISVQDNTSVTDATVRYRLIKLDSEQNETVITGEGDWLELTVDSQNLNPKAEFPVSQVALKAGEAVAIEAYQDSAQDDTVLNISLGNPTATVVTGTSNYSGSSTTYKYFDYCDNNVFHSDGSNVGTHTPIDSRWNTYIIQKSSEGVSYTEINTLRTGWKMIYNDSIGTTGYYYQSGKLQVSVADTGVAFEFIAPQTGNATISLPLKSSAAGTYVRILKNGNRVYPANVDWEELSTSASTVQAACEVAEGDVISLEVYGTSSTAGCNIDGTPSVTVASKKDANNLEDTTFSPLWERPYNGSSYVGSCIIPDGSVWSYEFLNVADGTTTKADYYDSYKKLFYKEGTDNCGYIFEEDSLKFAFGDGAGGMSLVFNVPSRGYYDLSSAFELSEGGGKVKVRILKNDTLIWPTSGEWTEFTDTLSFDAMEIGANSGDKIKIEAYAENSSNAVITLGTPIIQRLANRQYTETGNITVYKPSDYTAFEKGYNGSFIQLNSRFTYSFNDGALIPVKSNSAEQKLLANDNNYFAFTSDGAVKLLAETANTAEIKYTSIMAGSGSISLSVSEPSDGAEFRILKNTDIISDWAKSATLTKELEIDEGDVITVQFKGTGNVITVDAFNISLIGQHNNTNSAEDDGFFAAYADPYSDKYYSEPYNGTYKKNDNEYWNFDFYNSADDTVKSANTYSTSENHKIYRDEYADTGYYFGDAHLTADLNVKAGYGIALGFTAPRTDTFNTRYGFRLVTENEEAVIKTRIIKISADSGEASQIWPNGTEWCEKTVKTGGDITIPYAELSLKQGDTVYFEAYAASASADKVTVNLVSPAFIKETVEQLEYSDIKAKIYNAYNYGPYNYIDNYNGTYIPMDNRWNFYLADVTDSGNTLNLFNADTIRTDTNNEHSFYSSLNNIPQFLWNVTSKTIAVKGYVAQDKNIGAVMEFACPYSGNISVTAAPTVGTIALENAALKYRIIMRDAVDNSVSTVWPNNGTDQWEILNSAKTQSDCMDLELEVELGDVLEFQCYWDVPADKLDAYLTANSVTYWRPEFNLSPAVTATEWVKTDRTSFDAVQQFIPSYLINPYWRVQYSLNDDTPDWKYATQYKNIYWQSSAHANIGISKNGLYAIEHMNNSFEGYNPILAWLFTSKSEGRLTMSGTKVISVAKTSTTGYNALIRITVNNEQVYPEAGWKEVSYGSNLKLTDVSFEVKAGDQIRFEVKASSELASGDMLRLAWTPAFTISNEVNIYTDTDDIYNMLDSQMYEVFMSMDGTAEFDQNLAENKLLSARIKNWMASIVPFDYSASDDENVKQQSIGNKVDEDTYTEWTEEIFNPGGGWRKVIRYAQTAWWVYALIIVGAVVAVGGITTVVILIIKKKKIKKSQISNEN